MLKRTAALICLVIMVSATPAAAKGKPKVTFVSSGSTLTTSPSHGKPNTPFALKGVKFAKTSKIAVQMFCATSRNVKLGTWNWIAHSNTKGNFSLKLKVPKPKKMPSDGAQCNFYALSKAKKAAYWVSTSFVIT